MAKLGTRFIQDAAITDDKVATGISKSKVGLDNVPNVDATDRANHTGTQAASTISDFDTAADARITAQKGANNGIAELDAGGKVPVAQLPSAVMTYEGTWDASTNTPSLSDGTGDAGQIYRVSVAGSQDLGSGSISFDVGDYAIYNSSGVWEKSDTTDAVASVNGQTGIVVLDADDIDDSATTNKFTSQAQLDKVDFLTVTQAVDLDTLESDVATNNAKISADGSVTTHNDVTDAGSGAIITSAERTTLGTALQPGDASTQLDHTQTTPTDWTVADGSSVGAHLDEVGDRLATIEGGQHDAVTLNADDATQQTLNLSGQELQVNQATTTTDGAMSAEDKLKLDGIESSAKDDQDADEVPYSNATSGLTATDVQAAIDEVEGRVDTLEGAAVRTSSQEVITLDATDITNESVALSQTPVAGSVAVYVEGVRQTQGVDYSVSGSTLRFGDNADVSLTSSDLDPSVADGLVDGDVLVVDYIYEA